MQLYTTAAGNSWLINPMFDRHVCLKILHGNVCAVFVAGQIWFIWPFLLILLQIESADGSFSEAVRWAVCRKVSWYAFGTNYGGLSLWQVLRNFYRFYITSAGGPLSEMLVTPSTFSTMMDRCWSVVLQRPPLNSALQLLINFLQWILKILWNQCSRNHSRGHRRWRQTTKDIGTVTR